jgi:3-dehydroquinate dehydratase
LSLAVRAVETVVISVMETHLSAVVAARAEFAKIV